MVRDIEKEGDMPRRKSHPSHPPTEWVSLLEKYDPELARVRMLCRSGGQDYRPMVPDAERDELEAPVGTPWDPLEMPGAHFEWISPTEDSPLESRERISEIVEDLWEIAKGWTHVRSSWCDFKLVGYDSENQTLFEDGKRCFRDELTDLEFGDDDDPEDGERFSADVGHGRFYRREQERRMDARMNHFVDRMMEERDKSFDTARQSLAAAQEAFVSIQKSIDTAPQLISKASEVLKESIDYQNATNRQIRDQHSGKIQMQAHALSEMERSKRFGMGMEFGKYVWDSAVANVIPLANRFAEVFSSRGITVIPEFRCAQQAMAYLVGTMTTHQLELLFGDKRKQAPGAFLGVMDQGAKIDNEREALEHIADLLRFLRSEKFRAVADPEQQLAARYIIGRWAMYRMGEYGEEEEEAEVDDMV